MSKLATVALALAAAAFAAPLAAQADSAHAGHAATPVKGGRETKDNPMMMHATHAKGTTHSPIPDGTYATTITKADAPKGMRASEADSLVGAWTITMTGTHYTVQFNGAEGVAGDYQAMSGHRVHFDAKDTGTMACATPSTYHVVASRKRVVFHKVSDACAGRALVLTAHPLVRQM